MRKHDRNGAPHVPRAPKIVYPTSLEDLIGICKTHPRDERLHAGGSHWSLSNAAVSDHTFIETNDPGDRRPAMSRTLHNVLPRCMEPTLLNAMGAMSSPRFTFVHVESGKRIYQLYSELDQVDSLHTEPHMPETLAAYMSRVYGNRDYARPWAFATLGGAGGQTVVGAISSGTHGGDFRLGAVGDSVRAIHLVVDGGKHFWIEPLHGLYGRIADEDRLRAEYGQPRYGGPSNFCVLYDDELFYAVLVSAGRFGVIYSIVLEARPQYALFERRRLANWQEIKGLIRNPASALYYPDSSFTPPAALDRNRFLQIALCLTPHGNFQLNRVGITQRWEVPLPPQPQGRKERVGRPTGVDPRTGCTSFEHAGRSHGYSPPDHPGQATQPSLLEAACADASFLKGVIDEAARELKRLIDSDGALVGGGVAAVAVIGGAGLLVLLGALVGLVVLLRAFLDNFGDDTRLGEVMEKLKNLLLDPPIPGSHAKQAGLFVWQLIAYKVFELLQKERDYEAISYAVMDQHDYLNRSCEVNGDSIEVFFDAVDDRLIAASTRCSCSSATRSSAAERSWATRP